MPQWENNTGLVPPFLPFMPPDTETLNKEHLAEFFRTMYERQEIWVKRHLEGLKAPWTDDEYLRDYKFCNVYRVLDRNSQYEWKHVIKTVQSPKDFLFRVLFFRYFNQPDFFKYVAHTTDWRGGVPKHSQYDQEVFEQLMKEYRRQGGNPFTNAYLTNSLACKGKTRDWCFANKIIPTLHERAQELTDLAYTLSPKEWCKEANTLPSVSGFVSHEFFLSLCYREEFGLGKFNGWNRNMYTNVGPGCSLGLSLILPNRKTNKEQYDGLLYIHKIAKAYLSKHHPDFQYLAWEGHKFTTSKEFNITITDIEFWLCEYQKYWKMTIGVGKQRSKYTPRQ